MDNNYEHIIPWNGASDTGRDVRLKLRRNFERIAANFGELANRDQEILDNVDKLINHSGKFLRKDADDTASGHITFAKGVTIGDRYGITEQGQASLSTVSVDRIHDPHSTETDRKIIGAQGFDLYMGEDGKSHMYVDYFTTRVKAFFAQLEVRKISYSGGTTIFSNAGSTIARVAHILNASGSEVIAYKCYAVADDGTTRTANWWHPGMMALCQTFNVKAGVNNDVSNRYYWRLVIDAGQETLEDGKLYDYVTLSNRQSFSGSDSVVPTWNQEVIGYGTDNVLTMADVAVGITTRDGLDTFANIARQADGITTDEDGNPIEDRIFYGFEKPEFGTPQAPTAGDVIVNVGDQLRPNSRGNVIMLSTSSEDGNDNTAPAISMYHGIGSLWQVGETEEGVEPIRNPYQWKRLTAIISPQMVKFNADMFKFFTGSSDNVIDPIMVYHEIIPSDSSIVRHPTTKTTTPSEITVAVIKHTGAMVKTLPTTVYKLYATYTTTDGKRYSDIVITRINRTHLGVDLYALSSLTVYAKDATDKILAKLAFPILSDGDSGEDGSPGTDGTDANILTADPTSLIFDTDDSGKATGVKTFKVRFQCGEDLIVPQQVVITTENFAVGYQPSYKDGAVTVDGSQILSQTVESVEGGNRYVSCTSAAVIVSAVRDTLTYTLKVPVQVNVSSYMSRFEMTAKKFQTQFEALENDLKSDNPNVLNKYTSAITQTAKNISLEVKSEINGELSKSGIDVESNKITLTSKNTVFVDANGNEVAIFDENGINTKHVWAKSEDGASVVGHFGNYEIDACVIDSTWRAPLFVGGATAATSPFYVRSDGYMRASAGQIGNFIIENGSLATQPGSLGTMKLHSYGLDFSGPGGHTAVAIGPEVFPTGSNTDDRDTGGVYVNTLKNYRYEVGCNIGITLDVSGTMDKTKRENQAEITRKFPYGNHAIFIRQGDVAGFRPMLTKATQSRRLSKMEHTIHCSFSSDITLTLPDDPEIGQRYEIVQLTGRWDSNSKPCLYIHSNKHKIWAFGCDGQNTYKSDWAYTRNILEFDGEAWYLTWHASN